MESNVPLNLLPRRRVSLAAALVVSLLAAMAAPAAVVTFSVPANCAADTDIKVSGGGQLFAFTWGGGASLNGLPFTGTTVANGAVGPNLFLSTFSGANATAFVANSAPFNALSGSYSNILRGSVFNGTAGTFATATLSNLLSGHTYFVQLWVGDPRSGATATRVMDVSSGGPVVRLDFNVGNAAGGVGQYVYATFTADATTQDIVLDSAAVVTPDTGVPQMNAIQLRDVTGVWSGTTSGEWSDTDTTSQNFSGVSYAAVKAVASDVYFGDKDAAGNAVTTSTILVGSGGVTGANARFNNSSVSYLFASADATGISGAYGVTLSGGGTVTLNAPNTFTGNTTVNAGTLILGHTSAIGGSSAVVLGGGTLDVSGLASLSLASGRTLSGFGTILGSVSTAAGSTVVPGGVATAGTLSIGNNLTLAGQSLTFDLGFGPSSGDKIVVGNTLTVNSSCIISLNYLNGALAGGTYTLMTFASKAGAGTFTLDAAYPGVTLNVNPTSVTLTVAGGGGTPGVWTNLVGGTWGAATNWQGNTIGTNVDGVADFSTLNITAARTVTINGIKTIGHLLFGDTVQDFNWTLSTGTNILAVTSGSPKVIVNNGQNTTISSSLQGTQGFTKLGAGTLTLSGANVLSGGININAGTVVGSAAGSFGSATVATANPITLSNALLTISAALANNAWTNNLVFIGTSNTITAGAATPGFKGTAGSSVFNGSGIVTLNCGGNTPALAGHMDGFSGTLIINGTGTGGLLFGHNQDTGFYPGVDGLTGSSSAVFDFEGGGVNYMYNGALAGTNYLGELRGNSAAVLWAKNGRSGDVTLEIGGLGTSSEFAGAMKDNRNGTSPTFLGVRKVGAGTLTLSGASINTGPTEVWNGTLVLNGSLGVTPITVKSGGIFQLNGLVTSPTININSGGKLLVGAGASLGSAAITLNGLMDVTAWGGSFNLGSSSLSGSGVVAGSVTVASTLVNPGPVGGAGTLTVTNGNFTATGGTLEFDLSNTPSSGNDLLDVNGNLDFSTPGVTVNINKIFGTLGAGTYLLAKCSGTLIGTVGNLTLVGANPADALQFNGNRLELVVSAVPILTWKGDGVGNLWDINVSTTWLSGATPAKFTNGNAVTFTNIGGTNPTVNIPVPVAPATVTVSGFSNYTFVGAGDITGGTALLKSGTGTLTVLNTNSFVGNVFLSGGTLAIGNAGTNGSLAADITNSAALIISTPLDQTMSNNISGTGSVTKTGAGQLTLTGDSTITGPTTISAGTLSVGDGVATSGSLGTGIVTNNATMAINRADSLTMSNAIRNQGNIANLANGPVTLAGLISGTGSITNGGAAGTLNLSASNSYSGGTFITGGEVMLQNFSGAGSGPINIDDTTAGELHFAPVAGATNVLANNIKLPIYDQQQFMMDGTSLGVQTTVRLNGVLSGGASSTPTIFVDSGVGGNTRGVLLLANPANTFTTTPEVFRGTLAFASDGALGAAVNGIRVNSRANWTVPFDVNQQGLRFDAPNITLNSSRAIELVNNENIDVQSFNGTIAGPISGLGLIKLGNGTLTLNGTGSLTGATAVNAGTLQVNGAWSGSSVTVNSGATLGGVGNISAPTSINSGGTLSPGASIGTLTVSDSMTLIAGSTTIMELNAGSLTCDKVVGMSTLNYGGTLTVINTGGTLAQGQTYQLFSSAIYGGSFTTTNLPALTTGLSWNWNPANGTLSVTASVATNPTNITASVSGGNLNLSWPADHTGWQLQAQTNAPLTGLSTNWVTVPGSTSVNSMSFPIDHAKGSAFFRLAYP